MKWLEIMILRFASRYFPFHTWWFLRAPSFYTFFLSFPAHGFLWIDDLSSPSFTRFLYVKVVYGVFSTAICSVRSRTTSYRAISSM